MNHHAPAHYAIVLFRQARLSGGVLLFLINGAVPLFPDQHTLYLAEGHGKAFTLKTFCAVGLLSLYSELLPRWIVIEPSTRASPLSSAACSPAPGCSCWIRHQASLGGLGVLAIYLQKEKGWRAGNVQMLADGFIVLGALFIVDIEKVALSILAPSCSIWC